MKTRNAIKIQNLAKGSTVSSADESNCIFAELTEEEMTMIVGGLTVNGELTAQEREQIIASLKTPIITADGIEGEVDFQGNITFNGQSLNI